MANLTVELPDDLARSLEGLAAAKQTSVQQLAIMGLRALVAPNGDERPGSPAALLRALNDPPHPSTGDVDDFDAAIASGRLPVQTNNLFSS